MTEVEAFLDCFDAIGDLPMREEKLFPVCRVCGGRIKKRAKIVGGPYCPKCKKRNEKDRHLVAVISY